MAALKGDYLRSILLRASIWKPLGSRAPLASLAALARSLRSPHTGAASILQDFELVFRIDFWSILRHNFDPRNLKIIDFFLVLKRF